MAQFVQIISFSQSTTIVTVIFQLGLRNAKKDVFLEYRIRRRGLSDPELLHDNSYSAHLGLFLALLYLYSALNGVF